MKTFKFSSDNIVHDPDYNNIDFFKQIPKVEIPVFFISGNYDYILPWTLVERYCASLKGPHKEKVFEAYAEQKTPAAYRIFWYYGPEKNQITTISITPHP